MGRTPKFRGVLYCLSSYDFNTKADLHIHVIVMDIWFLITCAVIMMLVKKYQLWLKLSA